MTLKTAYSMAAHIGVIGGATLGAFSMRSPFKRKDPLSKDDPADPNSWTPVSRKAHVLRVLGGAAVGGLAGGLLGHQVHKNTKFWKNIGEMGEQEADYWRGSAGRWEKRHSDAVRDAQDAWSHSKKGWDEAEKAWKSNHARSSYRGGAAAGGAPGGGAGKAYGGGAAAGGAPGGGSKAPGGGAAPGSGPKSSWNPFGGGSSGGGAGSAGSAGSGRTRSYYSSAADDLPDWLKGVTSKAEAKKKFREMAMNNHPDRGGNTAKMQEINKQWKDAQKHQKFPKTASVMDSFVDELFEIYWQRMQ